MNKKVVFENKTIMKIDKSKKQIITAFILGAIVAVFGFHAYFLYQIRQQVIQNTASIQQIVNFLNQNANIQNNQSVGTGKNK